MCSQKAFPESSSDGLENCMWVLKRYRGDFSANYRLQTKFVRATVFLIFLCFGLKMACESSEDREVIAVLTTDCKHCILEPKCFEFLKLAV